MPKATIGNLSPKKEPVFSEAVSDLQANGGVTTETPSLPPTPSERWTLYEGENLIFLHDNKLHFAIAPGASEEVLRGASRLEKHLSCGSALCDSFGMLTTITEENLPRFAHQGLLFSGKEFRVIEAPESELLSILDRHTIAIIDLQTREEAIKKFFPED